jgi:hypothetical protein
MCDASDYAVGVVLGHRDGKNLNVIQYSSRLLMRIKRFMPQLKNDSLQLFLHVTNLDFILLTQR